MSRLAPFAGLALLAWLLGAPAAVAQTVEAGAFGGLSFGVLGATRHLPAGYESEWWLTLAIAAGVKTYVTRNLGLRFEARGYYTPIVISGAGICGGYGRLIAYAGTGTFQGDISAGVIVAF